MKKLLLIDTFNFLHRAYHALPKTFRDARGEPTNAVYGVASMIISIFEHIKPDYVAAALDGEKPTFRAEEFTAYKAHRTEMEEDLKSQISKVFEVLEAFGIKQILVDGYEADDVIGTLATRFAHPYSSGFSELSKESPRPLDVIIASNDRDLWQLVNGSVTVMLPTTKGAAEWIGPEEVKKRMGFGPDKIADYKGLRGDPSDNIPGVYGIGDKTAKKLIAEFGSLENIYTNLKKVQPESLRKKLEESYETALQSKNLAKLIIDAPFTLSLDECEYDHFDNDAVIEVLKKYGFKSLMKRLGYEEAKKPQVPENQLGLF